MPEVESVFDSILMSWLIYARSRDFLWTCLTDTSNPSNDLGVYFTCIIGGRKESIIFEQNLEMDENLRNNKPMLSIRKFWVRRAGILL